MKTVQNTSVQSSEYRDLPVTQLVESPTNPRKRYNEASLQELAESIKAQGVLMPLLVREVGEKRFEVIFGSRRFRAAQLAEAPTVPVRVVGLSDSDSILAQLVENLQREDIHPLEEANGFRALLDLPDQQFNVAAVAAKAGKSPQYVAQRLKLTELIPPLAEAFLADKLTLGHALLIAKLPPAQQDEAFKAAFKPTWTTNGQADVLIPVRELASWIESNILLDLQAAPFDRSAEALVSEVGSCHACPKRTGANTLLFPEADRDQCLDRDCYHAKVNAHVATAIERNPQLIQISTGWGTHNNGILGRSQYVEVTTAKASRNGRREVPADRKTCPHITKAIVVEGNNRGHAVNICADPSCEVHHAESRKARESQERMRAEQRKQGERRKQDLASRQRTLTAILAKVSAPLSKADLELITDALLSRMPQEHRALLSQRHTPTPPKGKTAKPVEIASTLKNLDESGYCRLLIEIALLDAAHNSYSQDNGERLNAVAKRYRVNAAKIAEAVAAEFATRRKAANQRRKVVAKTKRNGSQRIAAKAGA